MLQKFYTHNGINLTDITKKVINRNETSVVTLGTTDKMYIGTDSPINHIHFDLVDQTHAATIVFKYYSKESAAWVDYYTTVDCSENLTTSGNILFTSDKTAPPYCAPTPEDIPNLGTAKGYNKYWTEISATTPIVVTLNWIGYKFISTTELYSVYPGLSSTKLLAAFNQADWSNQIISASNFIVGDLQTKQIITNAENIVNPEMLRLATAHRTASLIYNGTGDAGVDNSQRAMLLYEQELQPNRLLVDSNKDGRVNPEESAGVTFRLTR